MQLTVVGEGCSVLNNDWGEGCAVLRLGRGLCCFWSGACAGDTLTTAFDDGGVVLHDAWGLHKFWRLYAYKAYEQLTRYGMNDGVSAQ